MLALNIQQMKYFLCIAKTRNLYKASEELSITPQALSKSMRTLESELGSTLLQRTGNGSQLTEFGNKVRPVMESLIRQYDGHVEIIYSLAQKNKKLIRISFEHIFLPFIIPAEFNGRLGEINTKTIIANDVAQCMEDVAKGNADIGVCQKLDDFGELEYVPIIDEQPVMLMHKDHWLASKESLRLSDLNGVEQVLPILNCNCFSSYIDACIKEGFYPNFVFESSDLNTLIRTVLANRLIQFTASFALTEYSSKQLVTRPIVHESLRMQVGFLIDPSRKPKPHVKSFVNALASFYGANDWL